MTVNIESLTDEAMKLMRMELDDLYSTLGGQLLVQAPPSRVAGIVSFLSALRSAAEAKSLYAALPIKDIIIWGSGAEVIYGELKRDGMDFLQKVIAEIRKTICNEDVLRLSDQINRSSMQVILMVVEAALRLPRDSDSISATVAVILLKLGLRDFCRQCEGT